MDVFSTFTAAFEQHRKEVSLALAPVPTTTVSVGNKEEEEEDGGNGYEEKEECRHEYQEVDRGCFYCMECSKVLQENFLVVVHGDNFQKRKTSVKKENIYRFIPLFVSTQTRTLTVELFNFLISLGVVRHSMKKAVTLACLHRASNLAGEPLCFDDILEMMDVDYHEANRGMNLVTMHVTKTSSFCRLFLYDDMSITSTMTRLGLTEGILAVERIYRMVKKHSELLNTSHHRSMVCGCIMFWLKNQRRRGDAVRVRDFIKLMGVSEMTVGKKYVTASRVMYRQTIPTFFSMVMRLGDEKSSKNSHETEEWQMEGGEVFVHRNPRDPSALRIRVTERGNGGRWLPLDQVDDISEWNVMLDGKTYVEKKSGASTTCHLRVLKRRNGEPAWDFKQFDRSEMTRYKLRRRAVCKGKRTRAFVDEVTTGACLWRRALIFVEQKLSCEEE